MELKEAINKRHCIRKFKSKACNSQDILTIMDSAMKAPCAGGLFSVRMILVEDKETKAKLSEAALDQDFIGKVSHVVVVCSDGKQTKRMYGKYSDTYLRQQAGAAIENMLLTATDLGISSCWVGAFDENAVRRVLQIPEDVTVEAILPLGYANEKPSPKNKPELKSVVKIENYLSKPVHKKRIEG